MNILRTAIFSTLCIVAAASALVVTSRQDFVRRDNVQQEFVTQKLGAHIYVIPKGILESIYKPDYSRDPNPNPAWPHEAVIRLFVRWPDFSAPPKSNQLDDAKNRLLISLGSLKELPVTSVEKIIANRKNNDSKFAMHQAAFGLTELYDRDTGFGWHRYVASPSPTVEFEIVCFPPGPVGGGCQFEVGYSDLKLVVVFSSDHLIHWKNLYENTTRLIDLLRK
ncbi:hypothetical protein [Methylosinus sp. KRF6]|uniref:hypothetical protein n=1 Tax=Methylosinus sp. KRF6 TaxID=2846853 RepID=UPI001C0DA21F|nr:hypothetical protein [Methylosinus sp. KRF6]MBU3891004.1 hypothetical protein [Methylosinus sp. KRF6]